MNILEEIEKNNRQKWRFILIAGILAIPLFIYRFNHPQMTETELFLNTWKAYLEFFNVKVD